MMKDRFIKGMLVIIALLLALNLFSVNIFSLLAPEAVAKSPQNFTFRGNGIGITCSQDGKYVFAAGNGGVFRSTNFGEIGSWEAVLH
jgi:hypothetical protein